MAHLLLSNTSLSSVLYSAPLCSTLLHTENVARGESRGFPKRRGQRCILLTLQKSRGGQELT